MKRIRKRFDRRTLLKGLAMAATGVVGGGALADYGRDRSFRVAVLQGDAGSGRDGGALLAGFTLGLETATDGRRVEAVPLRAGATPSRIAAALAGLLERDPVDLIVGPLAPAATVRIAPLLALHRTPLIVAGAGANTVRPDERSPWIAYNTLGHWRGTWALGAVAAGQLGTRIAVVTSLFDSGFDHLYAFEAAVAANGGELAATLVTDRLPGEHDLVRVIAELEAVRPDVVFFLHSDPIAHHLIAEVARVPELAQARIVTSGLTQGLAGGGQRVAPGVDLRIDAWFPDLDLEANRTFMSHFRRDRGGRVDAVAVLGYETARLAHGLLERIGRGLHRADGFAAGLSELAVVGPRGTLHFDRDSMSFTTPIYARTADGSVARLDRQGAVSERHDAIRRLHAGPRSGWLTDYPAA